MSADLNEIRDLLGALGTTVQTSVRIAQEESTGLDAVAQVTAADTIYRLDAVVDAVIFDWLDAHWPAGSPVRLVMEGLEEDAVLPTRAKDEPVAGWLIIDPVDGTRPLMADKRSAWCLAAWAPAPEKAEQRPRLRDLQVACMTELPPRKQGLADQVSGIRGLGREGIRAVRIDLRNGHREGLGVEPSAAETFEHSFATISRFFPEGLTEMARIEEDLWRELGLCREDASPVIFNDQYTSTGGQMFAVLSGHDRMVADIRAAVFPKLDIRGALPCHPYDACCALLLEEVGAVVEDPATGGPVDAPLDTTTPVGWVAYANETLAAQVREVLGQLIRSVAG